MKSLKTENPKSKVRFLPFAVLLTVFSFQMSYAEDEALTVRSLRITGNEKISDRKLRRLMMTRGPAWYAWLPFVSPRPFHPDRFADDVRRIETYYKDNGYFNAVVTSGTVGRGGRVDLVVRVEEGGLTRLQDLRIEGLDSLAGVSPGKVLRNLSLRAGRPFRRLAVEPDKLLILAHLIDRGYPYATVSVSARVQPDEGQGWVTFRVTPGPRATFGGVRVEGNARVSARTVLRGLDFRPGEVYREGRRLDTQRLLYRTGVFRAVTVRPNLSDSARTSVPVEVSVQERPFNLIRIGGGYDTEEEFRGSVMWGRRNFLGGARNLTVTGKASRILIEGRADLRQPFVIDSRTDLGLGAFIRRLREPGIRGTQVGGTLGLSREFAEQVVGALQYEQKLIRAGQDTLLFNIRASFLRDRRDNVFDPQAGAFFLTSAEQVFVQRAKNFFRVTADGRWYRQLTRRMTFAVRVFGGGIRGEIIPLHERFFAGGASSVRGWGLQELGRHYVDPSGRFRPEGGKYKAEGSAELRWRLPKRMGAAVFVDFGNIGNTLSIYDFSAFTYTVGGGLRYISPIGPIRIDVGYKAKDPFRSKEAYGLRRYGIHFSLGQAF